jgi:hypothetical protein
LLHGYLAPLQLVTGVSCGCEAATHATRRFIANMPNDYVVVKLDFANAFNSIKWDAVLLAIAKTLPDIYQFYYLAFQQSSILQFGHHTIESQEGVQLGDPLGPLLFCSTVQPLLSSTSSVLTIGYTDDFTKGGTIPRVASDVIVVKNNEHFWVFL